MISNLIMLRSEKKTLPYSFKKKKNLLDYPGGCSMVILEEYVFCYCYLSVL